MCPNGAGEACYGSGVEILQEDMRKWIKQRITDAFTVNQLQKMLEEGNGVLDLKC